ncbi:hypothetical protein [Burkholderia sp. Ac-20345]|uniref:hypothetical protein n=1 Tax=Burkholderia sp. Ac-20345 TaxID=2703891 RepID=UPI00197B1278|nr:hypothetical protein [Burkholderia sp. Ac-20345]
MSTKRQYALRERAVSLGWPIERTQGIDTDRGLSGASAEHQDGFQQLVSEVAIGNASVVFGLECFIWRGTTLIGVGSSNSRH